MIKIKFNTNFRTINSIVNSNKLKFPIRIIERGIIINPEDLEYIERVIELNCLRVQEVSILN